MDHPLWCLCSVRMGIISLPLSGAKLVGVWMGSPGNGLKVSLPHPPPSTRGMCESVIAHLLIEGYLQEDFHFTPYNTISYLLPGELNLFFAPFSVFIFSQMYFPRGDADVF